MFAKINSRRKAKEPQYVLMWHKGGYICGTDWSIARRYCKVKRLILGLVKIEGRAQMVYSFKLNGRWSPQGTIEDTGDREILLLGYRFTFIQSLIPECNESGRAIKFYPQEEYKGNRKLHKFGFGPFCRFSVTPLEAAGVYLLIAQDEILQGEL